MRTGPFGYGMRHDFQYTLAFDQELAIPVDLDGRSHVSCVASTADTAAACSAGRCRIAAMATTCSNTAARAGSRSRAPLASIWRGWSVRTLKGRHQRFTYRLRKAGVPVSEFARSIPADDVGSAEIAFNYDDADHVTAITGADGWWFRRDARRPTRYDEQGCLIEFCDALGGRWKYAYQFRASLRA